MREQIKITVEKDGKVTLKVEGVQGSECLNITEFFEKEMGVVLGRQRTSEFYRSAQVTVHNRITQHDS
jgi:hypothetical protein